MPNDVCLEDPSCAQFRGPAAPIAEARPITVTVRDKDIVGLEALIPRKVEIRGVALTEDGAALPNFVLSFIRKGGSGFPQHNGSTTVTFGESPKRSSSFLGVPSLPETPAIDGTFHVTLQEGDYQLRSANLPEGYYFKTLTAGLADLLRSALKISETDTQLRIVAVLARSSARVNVSGLLRSPAGSPLPAVISLVDINESTHASPIQPDGKFSVSRVPPGIHAVRLDLASGLNFYAGFVNVAETDRTGLEIAAPPLRQLAGRASLRGEGPLPTFTLIVSSGLDEDVKGLVDLTSPFGMAQFLMREGPSLPWAAALTVAPLPDGTFRLALPEGAYQVSVALKGMGGKVAIPGLQPEYHLDSLTFGSTDLLTEQMKVTRDSGELKVTLTPPLALSFNVVGQITGHAAAQGEARIELVSGSRGSRPPLEAPVAADGTFEFVKVPPGRYFARIAAMPGITVAFPVLVVDRDVRVSMAIPPPQEFQGRVVIARNERIELPRRLKFQFMGEQSQVEVVVDLARDATFRGRIPEGDFEFHQVTPLTEEFSPEQLMVVEMSGPDIPELQVVMARPSVAFGAPTTSGPVSLSGSVTGVSGPGAHVRLEGVALPVRRDAPIDDGRFKFAELPTGIYLVSIMQDGKATAASPSAIAVGASVKAGREIEIRPADNREHPVEASTGVVATQMLKASRMQLEMLRAMQFGIESKPLEGSPFASPTSVSAEESAAVANLQTITGAEVNFYSTNSGNFGEIPQLIAAGLLDNRFNTVLFGYSYLIVGSRGDYVAAAIPADLQSGRNVFFSTPDGVVRFTASKQSAPPGKAGQPVQ
jgi:hypothetical protein